MNEVLLTEPSLAGFTPRDGSPAEIWATIGQDALAAVAQDAFVAKPVDELVLRHDSFAAALRFRLARKLADPDIGMAALSDLIGAIYTDDAEIVEAAAADLAAIRDRDPACPDMLTPFLYFKGFLSIQVSRVGHHLWLGGRQHAARHIQSRAAEMFGVDIHPGAQLGRGLMMDHGTGVVIGETAVVGDDVSMLQGVTLGGTGKEGGDRHPKIGRGVLIGAGAKILGNIIVGEGAKVGAGSIVLDDVAPYTTVVGVPARPVGPRNTCMPGLSMDQGLPCGR